MELLDWDTEIKERFRYGDVRILWVMSLLQLVQVVKKDVHCSVIRLDFHELHPGGIRLSKASVLCIRGEVVI